MKRTTKRMDTILGSTERTGNRKARRSGSRARMALVGAATGALLLSACGTTTSTAAAKPANASPTSKKGTVDITWWNMWSGQPATLTKQMAAQFNSSQHAIHVTVLNVPSADGDAKLLSAIAAGDPPDLFTEWNPVIGEYAQTGAIQPFNKFETGKYATIEKWMYPVVADGGLYKGKYYAIPMSMNSEALYYNKSIMKAAGIKSPPKTLAQLDADQAKEWKFSGSRLDQIGFYPLPTSEGDGVLENYGVYFGVKGLGYQNGHYDLTAQPGAMAEAKWMASYNKYSNADVSAMVAAYGAVAGGDEDPFTMGKAGFELNGVWEAASDMPAVNPSMEHNFGVEPFPSASGGVAKSGSYINGNYNFIPKGAKNPKQAFEFIAWLAGFDHPSMADYYPEGGWMPTSPQLAKTKPFTSWEKRAPYVKTFVSLLLDPASQAVPLTAGETEYFDANATAFQKLATKSTTPAAALAYIDQQANAQLAKNA